MIATNFTTQNIFQFCRKLQLSFIELRNIARVFNNIFSFQQISSFTITIIITQNQADLVRLSITVWIGSVFQQLLYESVY